MYFFISQGRKIIVNMKFVRLNRKLVSGFVDGVVIFLMIKKRRNKIKRQVKVMNVKYIFGFNLGIYLIMFVMLKSLEILEFLVILEEVKLCVFIFGYVNGFCSKLLKK